MKSIVKLVIGLVLLSALVVWARPSEFRGDRFRVGGSEDIRSLTFSIDSLGASAINLFTFKTPRGLLFTGATVVSKTAFLGTTLANDSSRATVTVKSGAKIFTAKVDSGAISTDYRPVEGSWVHFDSAVTCTLTVDDGLLAGTGGLGSQVVFWYNVDYTNR